jgi:hypothetical protein
VAVKRIRQKKTITLSDDAERVLLALCDKRGQTQSMAIERMILKDGKEEGITPETLNKK